jgi:hypothetical protein
MLNGRWHLKSWWGEVVDYEAANNWLYNGPSARNQAFRSWLRANDVDCGSRVILQTTLSAYEAQEQESLDRVVDAVGSSVMSKEAVKYASEEDLYRTMKYVRCPYIWVYHGHCAKSESSGRVEYIEEHDPWYYGPWMANDLVHVDQLTSRMVVPPCIVFLSGCTASDMAQRFLQAGCTAVYSFNRPVNGIYALQTVEAALQALGEGKTLRQAANDANAHYFTRIWGGRDENAMQLDTRSEDDADACLNEVMKGRREYDE